MNVVGRVGSLISQGVYSVATPFHPFGGAVDIIVVEQQDGSYRSTPWYVRFGKFQGVLKGAEKVVTISVNGAELGFQMFLDNSGQAHFMHEVVSGSSGEASSGDVGSPESNEEQSFTYQEERADLESSVGSPSPRFDSFRYDTLEAVEDMVKTQNENNSEMVLVSIDGHVLMAPISSSETSTENVQLSTPQFHLGPGENASGEFADGSDVWESGILSELYIGEQKGNFEEFDGLKEGVEIDPRCADEAADSGNPDRRNAADMALRKNDTFKSCLDLTLQENEDPTDMCSPTGESSQMTSLENSLNLLSPRKDDLEETNKSPRFYDRSGSLSQSVSGASDDSELVVKIDCAQVCDESSPDTAHRPSEVPNGVSGNDDANVLYSQKVSENSSDFLLTRASSDKEKLGSIPENSAIGDESDKGVSIGKKGLGLEISLCGSFLRPGMGRQSAEDAFEAHRVTEEDLLSSGPSIIKNGNLIVRFDRKYYRWNKVSHFILGMAVFGPNFVVDTKDAIPVEKEGEILSREDSVGISLSSSRRWRLWPIPFRRSRSLQRSNSNSSTEDLFLDTESVLSPTAEQAAESRNQSPRKQYVRTLIPTNEQIASMKLKEGQNMITFSFSTRVLGKQQVDAHIYLWKWNARIVISDVDGTITRSDVLGQVMPLVGRDWTQSGVARLFSAIKENGYQLLFLSARAIVQAYLTKSFLFNLKQDGKALPNGPVVISPDGLFPSLFREVIRRAPHEFKIACLEDIKALFPSDYNPFYAGFGNRDTDELSYRKIGIPKGKIFIINPKGEVAINSCVAVKTYTSLHTLVNDMFPPTSMVEQEDYNSWNYWKMPLTGIDL